MTFDRLLGQRYQEGLKAYKTAVQNIYDHSIPTHVLEMQFERTRDWSVFNSLLEIETWFDSVKSSHDMIVEKIPISDCEGWIFDNKTGHIQHRSGDFFRIEGIRVRSSVREVGVGWDQPIITQVGDDGGILGLLRKRFFGIPHYLCEAKMEPGNYSIIQLSPTVQATFANIRKAHSGRSPFFIEYFMEEFSKVRLSVLYDQWLSEDGGRLFNKRNRGMLVEVSGDEEIELPHSRFRWLSLFQIKQLLLKNAEVNPHIRGILAHV